MKKLILLSTFFLCSIASAADYRAQLNGKFLRMSDSYCAGVSLTEDAGLFDEMDNNPPCNISVPARLKWIDGETFALIERDRRTETSPPRVFLYKVRSVKGTQVVLTSIWTGWGDSNDWNNIYVIQ